MERVMESLGLLRRVAQNFGPYLMLEIVMPGGTLLALLLFLYRRRKLEAGSVSRVVIAMTRTLGSFVDQGLSLWRPC
jgi:hypothetical protein